VKSDSEETCEAARRLLYCLGQANPRFTLSVYKGLVALFSSDLPIVQRMAATTVRRLQVCSAFGDFFLFSPNLISGAGDCDHIEHRKVVIGTRQDRSSSWLPARRSRPGS